MKRCVSSESRETRFSNDESQATTAKQPDERLIWGPYKTFRLDTGSISYLWSDETTLQSRTLSFRVEGPMRLGSLLLLRPFDLLQRHQRRQLGLLPANGHKNDNNIHNSNRGDKLFNHKKYAKNSDNYTAIARINDSLIIIIIRTVTTQEM